MAGYVCPDCMRPIPSVVINGREVQPAPKRGQDARCSKCRDDLPVNGKRHKS